MNDLNAAEWWAGGGDGRMARRVDERELLSDGGQAAVVEIV